MVDILNIIHKGATAVRPLLPVYRSGLLFVGTSVAPMRGRGFGRGASTNRGDMFRSRPPNTSRPPSMHVDDYMKMEQQGQGAPRQGQGISRQGQGSSSSMPPPPSIPTLSSEPRRLEVLSVRVIIYFTSTFSFSALTLLVGRQEGHPACKNRVVGCWHGYLSRARCRLAYGPADATATHCLLLQ